MRQLRQLIKEIHRRSLWQVLAIYIFAAWIGFQVIQTLTEGLDLPGWFPAFALVLFIVGLPIVLATAFIQEGIHPARHDPTLIPTARSGSVESLAASTQGTPGARRLFTWRNALVGGALAFGFWGVVATGWLLTQGEAEDSAGSTSVEESEGSPYLASIAVLPFENMAGTQEDEYFSDGITEEIISQLAQVSGLKVISRTSVVAMKGTSLTIPQIADTLGVRHILEGSVRRSGDRVRITVQLIEAESDAHLWAESYTRRLLDLFDVQEEIAREVSDALVTTVVGLRPSGSRTDEAAAYDAFLSGKYWLHGRTLDGLQRAIAYFEEAIAIDPAYAPAHAGLAQALLLWVFYSGGGADAYQAEGRALAMAERAKELDPNLAAGYYTRAFLVNYFLQPADSVAPDFERALELQPNSADLHGWYAHFLMREGKIEESLAEDRIALELDPLAPGRRLGSAIDALVAGRYDLALQETRRARALQPDLFLPKVYEAVALLLLGRPEDCVAMDLGSRTAINAICLHSLGRVEEASAVISTLSGDLNEGAEDQPLTGRAALLADVGLYYAWIGDADASLEWIERAFEFSPSPLDWRWFRLPLFDKVREDPKFQTGLQRLRETAWSRVSEHRDAELSAL